MKHLGSRFCRQCGRLFEVTEPRELHCGSCQAGEPEAVAPPPVPEDGPDAAPPAPDDGGTPETPSTLVLRRCGPWRTELESRPCRREACQAGAGQPCVTFRGDIASWPHAERWNDAKRAEGGEFYPMQEGHWVSGVGPRPARPRRPERPASEYDMSLIPVILADPAVKQVILRLEYSRQVGRLGYPIRAMVGAWFVKEGFGLGWARTTRLIRQHKKLRRILGTAPSEWACYRFAAKLDEHPDLRDELEHIALLAAQPGYPDVGYEAG